MGSTYTVGRGCFPHLYIDHGAVDIVGRGGQVFQVKDEKAVSNLFTEINAAEPVKLVDLPGSVDEASSAMLEASAL